MTVKEIRAMAGMNQKRFCDNYRIPLRTLQHWEAGDREVPVYVLHLLERCVLEDIKEERL